MLKSSITLKNDEIDSLAIGGFDGVHLGHQKLLSHLSSKGAVMVIHRGGKGLTPKKERCLYHDKACVFLELDDIKGMEAKDFVLFLQESFPKLKTIVVGYDFHFGKERKGDIKYLKKEFSGNVMVIEEVLHEGISVHSKKIKDLLLQAKVEKANALLGRKYSIKGDIIQGQGLGKKVLYPTINIRTGDFFLPKSGVYATEIVLAGKSFPSVTFIGERLSTDGKFSLETHILEEDLKVFEKECTVLFKTFLRENKKFENLGDLKEQISLDIQKALLTH